MGGLLMSDPRSRSRIPKVFVSGARRVLQMMATGKNVSVGPDFRAGLGSRINSLHGLKIGAHVSLGPGSLIEADGSVGDFVLISRGVKIVGRADHAIDQVGVPIVRSTWIGDREKRPEDEVIIERDVWIGANVVVLGGVSIGQGSVIGAGSVVSRSIPAFAVAVGVPARPVAKRFKSQDESDRHALMLDRLTGK